MSKTRDFTRAHEKGEQMTSKYDYLDLNGAELQQIFDYYAKVQKEKGYGWALFDTVCFVFDAGLHYGAQHERTQQKKRAQTQSNNESAN